MSTERIDLTKDGRKVKYARLLHDGTAPLMHQQFRADGLTAIEIEYEDEPTEPTEPEEWPKVGDEYWLVTTVGGVGCDVWGGYAYDKCRLSVGNVFRTKEEAKHHLTTLRYEAVVRKLRRAAQESRRRRGSESAGHYIVQWGEDKPVSSPLIVAHLETWNNGLWHAIGEPFAYEADAQSALDSLTEEEKKILTARSSLEVRMQRM